jgi:hypothetical protein
MRAIDTIRLIGRIVLLPNPFPALAVPALGLLVPEAPRFLAIGAIAQWLTGGFLLVALGGIVAGVSIIAIGGLVGACVAYAVRWLTLGLLVRRVMRHPLVAVALGALLPSAVLRLARR